MKRILSVIVIASMLVLSLSMTAFADETATLPTPDKGYMRYTQVQERIATRQAQIEQKRQEVSEFKAAAQGKSALVKAARDENKELFETITAIRKDLAKILADIKANNLTLDVSTLKQISNLRQQVRNIMDELLSSKGSIQSTIESNKESLKSMDYEVLESMYEDIIEIQSWRNEHLNEINRILNEILTKVQ
jgi:peptidoglycan hydrolase CwlO-like protein